MASIMKNEQQMKALEAIEAALTEVGIMNDMILALGKGAPAVKLTVGSGKKAPAIGIDAAYADRLIGILKVQRLKRISAVDKQAKKFRISLSDEEARIMSDEAIQDAPEPEEDIPPQDEPVSAEAEPEPLMEEDDAPQESMFWEGGTY